MSNAKTWARPCVVEGIPGTSAGVDYSAWRFDPKGNYVLPGAPGFSLELER